MRASCVLVPGLSLLAAVVGCGHTDPQGPRRFLHLAVAPDSSTLTAGDSLRLQAFITTTEGGPVQPMPVRWRSADPGVAEVSQEGVVIARRRGTVGVVASGAGSEAVATVAVEREPLPELLVIAHRGYPSVFPENTLVAVDSSFHRGADAVEVDVWVAGDGEFMIMHDSTVDRTTNGTGRMTQLSSAELRALDACSKKGPAWGSCPVPSVTEVLRTARGRGWVVLDLKGHWTTESSQRLIARIALERMRSRVIIAHSNAGFLAYLRWLDPRVTLGLLANRMVPVDSIVRIEAMASLVLYSGVTEADSPSYAAQLLSHGSVLGAWTIDSPARAATLRTRGVNWFISDVPLSRAALDTIAPLP